MARYERKETVGGLQFFIYEMDDGQFQYGVRTKQFAEWKCQILTYVHIRSYADDHLNALIDAAKEPL